MSFKDTPNLILKNFSLIKLPSLNPLSPNSKPRFADDIPPIGMPNPKFKLSWSIDLLLTCNPLIIHDTKAIDYSFKKFVKESYCGK